MRGLRGAVIAAALALVALASPVTASRAEARTLVTVGVGFNFGPPAYAVPTYLPPPPVYYAPPPVYVAPPAYSYVPPAVVVEPPPVAYYDPRPRYYVPRPVYAQPAYW